MRTRQFGRILADGARSFVANKFIAQAQHRRFCGFVEVKTFHAQDVTVFDGDLELLRVGDAGEVTRGSSILNDSGVTAQLISYARNFVLTREAILSSDLNALSSILSALGVAAARLESRLVSQVLQENPAMPDGIPLFHDEHGNEVRGAFSICLGQAVATLRNQRLKSGAPADLAAAHLVVSGHDEFEARKRVHESGMSKQVTVTALAGIPAGTGYLLADQEVSPTVALVAFAGPANRIPVAVESAELPIDLDGAGIRGRADLGATVVSHEGIVRINAGG